MSVPDHHDLRAILRYYGVEVIGATEVLLPGRAVQLAPGREHAVLLTEQGKVYAIGSNALGQCGQSLAYRGMRLRRTVCDREHHQLYPDEMKHVCTACGRGHRSGGRAAVEPGLALPLPGGRSHAGGVLAP